MTEFMEMNELRPGILNIAVPDEFVPHGSIAILRKKLGMDPESVAGRIINKLNAMKDASPEGYDDLEAAAGIPDREGADG